MRPRLVDPSIGKMAEGHDGIGKSSIGEEEKVTISKGAAKRKYLLTDDDLSQLKYEEKQNPFNKGYGEFLKIFPLTGYYYYYY